MAKGKAANPADAHRKALRKKELKKNKTERAKARDFALVKKDTHELEDDIAKLEGSSSLSPSDTTRLKELKDELAKITKKKEDYVLEHPEHRKLVFRSRKQHNDAEEAQDKIVPKARRMFNKNGLPRHPERSIYYDPIMNPYGVPPPGLPYIERPLRPDEIDSDQEDGPVDSDDDIEMPAGPPPDRDAESGEDADDDIPMPDGPPPSRGGAPMPPPLPFSAPPVPAPAPPPPFYPIPHLSPAGFPVIPAPLGFPGLPPSQPFGLPVPPPPPNFLGHSLSPMPNALPPPPPGFFPRRSQSSSAMQDPLSSIPHQTFQAHRASSTSVPLNHSLPPKPSELPPPAAITNAATVTAAPELRDLKKESTAFVPSALKRRRGGAVNAATSKINAAPFVGPADDTDAAPRPDLLDTLRGQLGTSSSITGSSQKKPKPGDDYTKFMEEMGDILGPSS